MDEMGEVSDARVLYHPSELRLRPAPEIRVDSRRVDDDATVERHHRIHRVCSPSTRLI